jgi:hypothetical protein
MQLAAVDSAAIGREDKPCKKRRIKGKLSESQPGRVSIRAAISQGLTPSFQHRSQLPWRGSRTAKACGQSTSKPANYGTPAEGAQWPYRFVEGCLSPPTLFVS